MKYFLNYLFDICSYLKQDLSGFTKNNTACVAFIRQEIFEVLSL